MRILLACLFALLMMAPAASAHHDALSCDWGGGGGLVSDVLDLTGAAACGAYHIATVVVLDDGPFLVNAACDVLFGRDCI